MGNTYTLHECVEMALRKNLTIRKSKESISLSQASNLLSYAEMLPYINARSSVTRNSTAFGTDPYTDMYSTNISLSQSVFDLSTLFNIQTSRNEVKKNMSLYNATVSEIEFMVAGYFFDFVKKKKLMNVKGLAFRESDGNLQKSKLMYDIGTISKIDLLRAEVIKNQSELDLLRAGKESELARANLAFAIGLELETELDAKEDTFAFELHSIAQYDSLLEEVYHNNPEIETERISVASGKSKLRSSYCKYFPKVILSGSYGYSGDTFTLSREEWDNHDSWSIGATISIPLFTGFSRVANVKQSRALLRIREIELDDVISRKGIELKKALLAIEEAKQTRSLAEKNLEKAELSYRMVQEKFNLGAATIIELIDAEQDYEQAQVTKISSYFDLLLTSLYVKHLLGKSIVE